MAFGDVPTPGLHSFHTVGKLVPALSHQEERGPDLLDWGKLHPRAIGGVLSVLFWCRQTDLFAINA